MKLKTWLDVERGRYTALAAHLDVSVSRVSQMTDDGVPVKFMQSVSAFTGGAVTIEDLVDERTPDAPAAPAKATA